MNLSGAALDGLNAAIKSGKNHSEIMQELSKAVTKKLNLPDTESTARQLYQVFSDAVGGKTYGEVPLPAAEEYFNDPKIVEHAYGWRMCAELVRKIVATRTEKVTEDQGWKAVSEELPDADIEVLVHNSSGAFYKAYYDDEFDSWYHLSGQRVHSGSITHWQDSPDF